MSADDDVFWPQYCESASRKQKLSKCLSGGRLNNYLLFPQRDEGRVLRNKLTTEFSTNKPRRCGFMFTQVTGQGGKACFKQYLWTIANQLCKNLANTTSQQGSFASPAKPADWVQKNQ